jgi:hypothetical protein
MMIPDFHEEMDRFQSHTPTWVGYNLSRLRTHWWRGAGFPPASDSGDLDAARWTCAARS